MWRYDICIEALSLFCTFHGNHTMTQQRIFSSAQHFQPTASGEPFRSVIVQTADAAVVAWHVSPGQTISAHVHPNGQDTWTVISGSGMYILNSPGIPGSTQRIQAGDIAVAPAGSVHGVTNNTSEPLRIIAVVSPAESGFELI